MRLILPFAVAAACLAAALPAHSQEPGTPQAPPAETTPAPQPPPEPEPTPQRRFTFGPNLGLFVPTSSKTRDAFGNTWTNIGFGVGAVRTAPRRGLVGLDVAFINNNRGGGRRALMGQVGVAYRRSLVEPENEQGAVRNVIPYFGAGAGLYLANLDSDKYDVSTDLGAGFGGSALVGVAFQRRAFLEARYHAVSRISGFDLSGLNVALGVRF